MNRIKPAPKGDKEKKDILDHIEIFIKKEILRKGREDEAGPLSYIEAFLKDRKVASIAPSTKFVVERVTKMLPPFAKVVIEYGPAEGVMTHDLLAKLPKDGLLVTIETNERFVASLAKIRDPRLKVLHGDVTNVMELLQPLGITQADAIVSGIPFSFFKPFKRHQLVQKTEELLRPGGRFIAYQVTLHLLSLMEYLFEKVDLQFELRNLPPNFILTGFKRA
jgi:phospholipid N-methyltransferase